MNRALYFSALNINESVITSSVNSYLCLIINTNEAQFRLSIYM